MTEIECRMLDLLTRGRDEFGVVAVKAEFEAEGTRPDEFLRLLHLARRADLKVALKIGGCEAVSDLMASRLYGVDFIIAPMVESPYALSKFIGAKGKIYPDDRDTRFLFNLETSTTLDHLSEMADLAAEAGVGVVFGRVDFTLSKGLPRGAINEACITEAVVRTAQVCRARDLELVVGGSVTADSIPVLREIRSVRLDRFETRKVVFKGAAIEDERIALGLAVAADFELLWLKSKRDYYASISLEDAARIQMMEARASTQHVPKLRAY